MFDAAKQYQEYAKEYQRFFSNNGAPAGNVEKINQLNQELAGAFANANKIVVDAAQKFAKQQSEFAQEQAQKVADATARIASAKNPDASVDSQTKFAQEAFDANVQNMQAAAKTASEAAVKIFDVINKQTVEYLSEISRIAGQNS